jgi:hypothetical protein
VVYEHEKAINISKHQTPEDKDEKGKWLYDAFKVYNYSLLSSSWSHIFQSSYTQPAEPIIHRIILT